MEWLDILKATRKHAVNGDITSAVLKKKTGLDIRVASAWLSKFVRWGYLIRAGVSIDLIDGQRRPGRPGVIYQLTSWGLRFRSKKVKASEPPIRFKAVANPNQIFKRPEKEE
jgi:hypothetical protein